MWLTNCCNQFRPLAQNECFDEPKQGGAAGAGARPCGLGCACGGRAGGRCPHGILHHQSALDALMTLEAARADTAPQS